MCNVLPRADHTARLRGDDFDWVCLTDAGNHTAGHQGTDAVHLYSMKIETQYRWRILWQGRWVTTSHHCTVEAIRREHPEAECIDSTRRDMQVAETWDERKQSLYNTSAARLNMTQKT